MVTCPKCGSTSTKQKRPQVGEGFIIVRNHACQNCEHDFQPPIPKSAAPALLATSLLFVAASVALIVWFLVADDRDKWRSLRGIATLALLLLGGGAEMLVTGLKLRKGEHNDNRIF